MTSLLARLAVVLGAAAIPLGGAPAQVRRSNQATSGLDSRIDQYARAFNGSVGIAVRSIDEGWKVGWQDTMLCPQQSVSKFWVALTAMEKVDQGRLSLDDRVTLTREDLTLFHQPIAAKILGQGQATTSVGDLLFDAITKSDNTANDRLMRAAGGPSAVRSFIARHNLGAIRFYEGERLLQSKIAGLIWSQNYSIGDAFYKARDALPLRVRQAAFNQYLSDPYDGAAPGSIVDALAKLKRGELLSPASTAKLLSIMGNTKTGANRLKGGLKPGWSLSHKTGTGQILGAVQAGYNDIGILTAPDGSSYSIAVMIKKTATPLPVRMTLMNNVVRAVIDAHEARRGVATL
ncbi:MAG: serine hydrolase [Sphingomicrobium sp.]